MLTCGRHSHAWYLMCMLSDGQPVPLWTGAIPCDLVTCPRHQCGCQPLYSSNTETECILHQHEVHVYIWLRPWPILLTGLIDVILSKGGWSGFRVICTVVCIISRWPHRCVISIIISRCSQEGTTSANALENTTGTTERKEIRQNTWRNVSGSGQKDGGTREGPEQHRVLRPTGTVVAQATIRKFEFAECGLVLSAGLTL